MALLHPNTATGGQQSLCPAQGLVEDFPQRQAGRAPHEFTISIWALEYHTLIFFLKGTTMK